MTMRRSALRLSLPLVAAMALSLSRANAQTVQIANAADSNTLSSTYPYGLDVTKFLVGANSINVTSVVIPLSGGIPADALFYLGDNTHTAPTTAPFAVSNTQLLPLTGGSQPVNVTFTFPSPVTLTANTTYWLGFGAAPVATNNIYFHYITSVDNSASVNGTAIAQGALSADGTSWVSNGSATFHYTIYGDVANDSNVPEPSVIAFGSTLTGLLGTLALRKKRQ